MGGVSGPNLYPKLVTGSTPEVQQAIRQLADYIYQLRSQTTNSNSNLQSQITSVSQEIANVSSGQYSTVLEGTHSDRLATGTANITNTSISYVSGTHFSTSWIGLQVYANGQVATINGVTSTTAMTVDKSLGTGNSLTWYLYSYSPVQYDYPLFYETDRTVTYIGVDATGNVSTSGVNVTLNSGTSFSPVWFGQQIIINSIPYTIVAIKDSSHLTIDTNIGVQTSKSYRVKSAIWQYQSGKFIANLASIPGDLGTADVGFQFGCLDYSHDYLWYGGVWQFGTGDLGSNFAVMTAGSQPAGGIWHLCDGSTVYVANGNGTASLVTLPNLQTPGNSSGPVLIGGGGGGFKSATQPSWQSGAITEDETMHSHQVTVATSGPVTAATGSAVSAAAPTNYTATTSPPSTPNGHGLTDANAKLKKPSDSSDSTHGGGMPDRYYGTWYWRL